MRLIIWFTLLSTNFTFAQDSLYQAKLLKVGAQTLPYRILLPKNYQAFDTYPLVLVLHGSGERGNDNTAQLVHGSALFTQPNVRENFPAIVVFPQCSQDGFWAPVDFSLDSLGKENSFSFPEQSPPTRDMQMVIHLLDTLQANYPVYNKQIYVMGLSMGGMGTFDLIARFPKRFAAAVPICGGVNTNRAKLIKQTPLWIFHGQNDQVVPVSESENIANAIQQFMSAEEMQLTIYPGVDHNSWDKAFAEKDLLPWLFSKRSK